VSIPPTGIKDRQLKTRFRGYSKPEVDQLLQELTGSYEELWRERKELRGRLDQLEKEIGPLREAAGRLTETLAAADKAAAELRKEAEHDADALLAQAREKARASQIALKGQQTKLKNEVERLRKLEKEQRDELRTFLTGALELIEDRMATKPIPLIEPKQPTEETPVEPERPSLHKTPASTT
jgi:cell division initiation protein